MATHTVNVRVCKTCGARYTTPGSHMPTIHTRSTGHEGFRTVREQRVDEPSRIMYQPGSGPR